MRSLVLLLIGQFILSQFFLLHESVPLKLTSASYRSYNVDVLGNQYLISLLALDFDQDLYQSQSLPCSPLCVPPTNPSCTPCDITAPSCMNQNVSSPSCRRQSQYTSPPFSIPAPSSYCPQSILSTVCKRDPSFIKLSVDSPLSFTVNTDDYVVFGFWNPDPCNVVKIVTHLTTGWVSLDVYRIDETTGGITYLGEAEPDQGGKPGSIKVDISRRKGRYDGPQENTVCPPFSYGSLYIVLRVRRNAQGTIVVTSTKLSNTSLSQQNLSSPLSTLEPETHYLLQHLTSNFNLSLSPVPGCHDYMFFISNNPLAFRFNITHPSDPDWILSFDSYRSMVQHFSWCTPDNATSSTISDLRPLLLGLELSLTPNMTLSFYYFSSIVKPEMFSLRHLGSLSSYDSYFYQIGNSRLRCQFGGQPTDDPCDSGGSECSNFSPMSANNPPALFWPLPILVWSRASGVAGIYDNSEFWTPRQNNDPELRLNSSLHFRWITSYDQDERTRIFYNLTEDWSCKVVLARSPRTETGEYFSQTSVPLEADEKMNCDASSLNEFLKETDSLFIEMDGQTGQALTDARFEIDTWLLSDHYYNCIFFIGEELSVSSLMENSYENNICYSLYGSDRFYSDPCCDTFQQWRTACIPRSYSVLDSHYSPNNETIQEMCSNQECIEQVSIPTFYSLTKTQRDRQYGCRSISPSSFSYKTHQLLPFTECLNQYVWKPSNCFNDSDCEQGRCDFTTFTCLVEQEIVNRKLFSCMWERLDSFYKLNLAAINNLTLEDPEDYEKVYNSYLVEDCINQFAKGFPVGRSGVLLSSGTSCDYANEYLTTYYDFDPSVWVPFEADYRYDCSRSWNPVSFDSHLCLKDLFCNWNSHLCSGNSSCPECEKPTNKSEYFCGWCEDGEHCVEIENITSSESCEQANVCVFPNSSYSFSMDTKSCQQVQGCHRPCLEKGNRKFYECPTAQECESLGGKCMLNTTYPDSVPGNWDYDILYDFQQAKAGVCIVNQIDLSQTDNCYLKNSENSSYIQKPTRFGCIAYTPNNESCVEIGGVWKQDWASSKQECYEMYGERCYQTFETVNFAESFFTLKQWILANQTQCELTPETATWQPMMEWSPGRWLSGVSRKAQWMKREWRSQNQINQTLDIPRLRADIESIYDIKLGYIVKTQAFCLYTQILGVVQQISCSCQDFVGHNLTTNQQQEEVDPSQCYSTSSQKGLAGITVICTGATSTAIFPPNKITIEASSGSQVECDDLYLYTVSLVSLQDAQVDSSLSTTLFVFEQKTNYQYVFKNSHKTFVGQIIGSGVSLGASDLSTIPSSELCVEYKLSSFSINPSYDVYDFAIMVDQSKSRLDPLGVATYFDNETGINLLCGKFPEMKINETYVPVVRSQSWESDDVYAWSTSEQVAGYFLATFYLICAIVAFIEMLDLYHQKASLVKIRQRALITILFLFSALRAIYFYLIMGDRAVENEGIVNYLLIDLVTILFFTSFITYLVYMWVNALLSMSHFSRYLTKLVIVVNVLIYVFFITMLVIYEEVGSKTKVYWCGQLRSSHTDTSSQDAVRLIYRIGIALIALVIGVSFIVVGVKLTSTLDTFRARRGGAGPSENEGKMKNTLIRMTFIISISFISQSIIFLCLEIWNNSDIRISVILLTFVEVCPVSMILFSLRPRPELNSVTKTMTSVKKPTQTLKSLDSSISKDHD